MADTLEQAIASIKAGDKSAGERLLAEALRLDPRNEIAWLWMTTIVDSDAARRIYLEQVLEINPNNQIALQGLAALELAARPADASRVQPAVAASQPVQPVAKPARPKPVKARTRTTSRLEVYLVTVVVAIAVVSTAVILFMQFASPIPSRGAAGTTLAPALPGQMTPLPIATPDLETQRAEWGTVDIGELLGTPDKYNGVQLHYQGQATTIQETDTGAFLQTWIQAPSDGAHDREAVIVFCRCSVSNVYQGMDVEFWGYGGGTIQVTGANGEDVQQPLIWVTSADYLRFNPK